MTTTATPGATLRTYVELTKPRIIELLLITTVPAMVVAADGWPGWGWNPIQAGDVFGNRPQLLSLERAGAELRARCVRAIA